MAVGVKYTHYKKRRLGLINDLSRTVTIQAFPKLELVFITPVTTPPPASSFLPRLNLLGVG